MTAVSLLDVLTREAATNAGNDAGKAEQVASLAAKLVESALADWQRVLELEQQFGSAGLNSPLLEGEINRSLYQIYQQWATEAQEILTRARHLLEHVKTVQRIDELEDVYCSALARLKLTPDDLARAATQTRSGQAVPIKELRGELRSRVRA